MAGKSRKVRSLNHFVRLAKRGRVKITLTTETKTTDHSVAFVKGWGLWKLRRYIKYGQLSYIKKGKEEASGA